MHFGQWTVGLFLVTIVSGD